MLLTNLAETDWMPISCENKIFTKVMCVNEKPLLKSNVMQNVDADLKCPLEGIAIKDKCFKFKWKHAGEIIKLKLISPILNKVLYIQFHHILDALLLANSHFSIFTEYHLHTLQYFKVTKSLNKIHYKAKNTSLIKAEGFFLQELQRMRIIYGNTMFRCKAGSYIMSDFVCNNLVDCPYDKSDEENCICHDNSNAKFCKYMKVKKDKKVCNHLYYTTHSGECCKYSTYTLIQKYFQSRIIDLKEIGNCPDFQGIPSLGITEHYAKANKQHITNYDFSCNNGQVIDKSLVNDIIPDCSPDAEDEPLLKGLLAKAFYHSCPKPQERPCMVGHKKCYNILEVCIYRLNTYHHITPCRNGGHRQSCSKFECNMMFKCSNSYCISWLYMCNGKWDCPGGSNEIRKLCHRHCRNMYKCVGTRNMCVHVGNMCNGYPDCPLGDDEQFCDIQKVICAAMCYCLLHAIQCQNNHKNEITVPYPQTYLFIFFFNVHVATKTVLMFYNALHVKLIQSFVTDICNVLHFPSCLYLNLRQNLIKSIFKKCLHWMSSLRSLDLSDNKIAVIAKLAFISLPQLYFLNISNNPLTNLPILFAMNKHLFLHMVNTDPQVIDKMAFGNVYIKVIITKDPHVCCVASHHTVCQVKMPWYISCSDILPNQTIKYFYVVISTLIILLNAVSALMHILRYNRNRAFCLIVIGLNVNDSLSGVYLISIWLEDFSLKGAFSVKEYLWRSGLVCLTAFTIILLFTILTQILLLFLSVSRLMIKINPINTKFKQLKFVTKSLVAAFLVSLPIAVFIASLYKVKEKHIPTSLCLPFIDPTAKVLMIKIMIWFAVITQLLSSLSMLTIHILLVAKLRKSHQYVTKSKSRGSDTLLIIQLSTVTLSNILCWFTSNSVYVTAMFSYSYPISLIIWISFIGLPINSLINPLTFISVFVRKCMKDRIKSYH